MAHAVLMPRAGNSVESCLIVEWRKNVGDDVSPGEIICEVETDKASVEVETDAGGILLARLYEEGDEVPVLTPIAVVGKTGEDVSEWASEKPATVDTPESPSSPPPLAGASASRTRREEFAVSPRARRLAAAEKLRSLPSVGSGPGGRVVERDVRTALAAERSSLGGPESAELDFPGPVEILPLKGARKVIADRMRSSLAGSAQFTLNITAPAASLLSWRNRYKNGPEDRGMRNITINDLVMFAAVKLLGRHPQLNATLHDGELRRYRHVHLGFAVDRPQGLMVPVIRYADTLSLAELSAEAHRLSVACRDGGVTPNELDGGSFTVTNLGALGVESFTPVLNPPEVAILGVGAVRNASAEGRTGELVLEKRIGLSLTIDHQALDGAAAGRFLQDFSKILAGLERLAAL